MKRLLAPIMFACLLFGCIVTASANPDPALDASPGQLIIDLGEQWPDMEFSLETEVGPYPGKIVVSSEGVLTMELGQNKLYRLTNLGTTAASTPLPSLPPASAPVSDAVLQEVDSNVIPLPHILLFLSGLLICVGILLYFSKKRK